MVLKLLEEKRLYAKPSKLSFGLKEVDYLVHIVSHEGVNVDPNKIKSTMEWKILKTLKNIKGFLGLIGYYNKFVKNYGRMVEPLTTLLNKDAFSYTLEATQYFEKRKEEMCRGLVLDALEFPKTFIVECYALGNGVGVVLMKYQSKERTYTNPFMRRK
jgi:hypothetical protein